MKAYLVGGAVRDELLGLPKADRDWVVVGATPEEMTAAGYRPVGRDFPVFLHPETHEEYALARTERKSGRGYRGFTIHASPEVTLEEDLARRDLTINAMARAPGGALVDPFGGAQDLRDGVLRHVSEAFAEDPVRVLRVARFAARYRFGIAEATQALMRRLVEAGEMEHLVAERVWQEFSRGLGEPYPAQMLDALDRCGALAPLAPAIASQWAHGVRGPVLREALARAAQTGAALAVRFALFAWGAGEGAAADCESAMQSLCTRLRAAGDVTELALAACRCREAIRTAASAPAPGLLEALKCADAFRRPERLAALLETAQLAEPGEAMRGGAKRLRAALEAARSIDAGAIAAEAPGPAQIAARIDAAREAAIARALG